MGARDELHTLGCVRNLIETEGEWLAICDAMYWDYFLVPTERADDWRRYFA
jgi:hypothetical protein